MFRMVFEVGDNLRASLNPLFYISIIPIPTRGDVLDSVIVNKCSTCVLTWSSSITENARKPEDMIEGFVVFCRENNCRSKVSDVCWEVNQKMKLWFAD